ncbi:uncharacterized protein LOC128730126 [Anopheles nili]|uniref:uncharacterized protein LOC128730126 n=1 Tax=Anopheles nili TaxID=185578 RepID=UPI00237AF7A6|nr:uncharacterized protein LOC128730126 [Anopheles nili]
MEDLQTHQQAHIPPLFPVTTGPTKSLLDPGVEGENVHDDRSGGSFGQDSGYTSYHSNTTPNNTFNLSSRHGASVSLATIDEANELDYSMHDTSMGPAVCSSINLTPKTAASIDMFSNIHLTTPKSSDDRPKCVKLPIAFNYDGSGGESNNRSSMLAPSTPDRLPLSRSVSIASQDTPLNTGNRSASQPIQLTPHKTKGASSLKRKHSAFREKLYSDGADPMGDENRPDNLNDSLDTGCHRLDDISPIPNVKRRKHDDRVIEDLMRSSTPKTVSSLRASDYAAHPTGKRTLRKFQSFSPSKMQARGNPHLRPFGRGELMRQNAFSSLEKTPEKKTTQRALSETTPSKEHRVLAELHPFSFPQNTRPPIDISELLDAPILEDPAKQLEHTVTTVPSLDDFSLTPSKTSLIDLAAVNSTQEGSFVSEDLVSRHAPNVSYFPTLNSILEESPIRAQLKSAKSPLIKTSPRGPKSARKPKRLGTNISIASSTTCLSSPARSLRSPSRPLSRASVSFKGRGVIDTNQSTSSTSKPYSFCHWRHMNILEQLSKRNHHALEAVLEYLEGTDLVNVVCVSRGWRAIIQNHEKSWKRLQQYLKLQEPNKENIFQRKNRFSTTQHELSLPVKQDNTGKVEVKDIDKTHTDEHAVVNSSLPERHPFKIINYSSNSHGSFMSGPELFNVSSRSSSTGLQSPPVSPSKQKFHNYQKLASHLKQSEQLRPCPRCEKPSRIIFSNPSKNKIRSSARISAGGNRLEKSYTLPDPDTGYSYQEANTHSSITATTYANNNPRKSTNVELYRNNNEYSGCFSLMTDSPNRVRKNLFNNSTVSSTKPSSATQPAAARRNSIENGIHQGTVSRMTLRSSAVKTVGSLSRSASEDLHGARDSKCDFAICSGQNCGFRFCIKCLCEYHPSTTCGDLAPNSPSKEEERERSNIACSQQSRRSLQRLCRRS